MAQDTTLSEHEAALASERKDRAEAMLGLPELIAGVQVEPLTPRRLEWLRAMGNPFICGGECPIEAIPDFLWYVTSGFKFGDDESRKAFLKSILITLNVAHAREGIESYIERAYLDAPTGTAEGASYYAPTIGIYHALKTSYPGDEWTLETVKDTPLRVIFQLLKCADRAAGCTVINRRSFVVQGKWLDEIETLTAENQEELLETMQAKRSEGYKQVTLSQKSKDGTWSLGMRKEPDAK